MRTKSRTRVAEPAASLFPSAAKRVAVLACLVVCVCAVAGALPGAAAESEWTDLRGFLVASDGSRSLGNTNATFNDTRDQGSKIVFFNPENGDNESGEVYWWTGERIVDSSGRATNADGEAYGADPLQPNEAAIKPFKHMIGGDSRLHSHGGGRNHLSTGYPDWLLFRRGQVHNRFAGWIWGGRSETEPAVVAAYGPTDDGRAVVDSEGGNPFSMHTHGRKRVQFHMVLAGLEFHQGLSYLGTHSDCATPGQPGVPTLLIEDCKIVHGQMNYLPIGTTLRKSISAFNWKVKGHNQGYFTSGFDAAPTFEEVIFYKNGYKTDPRTDPDPRRTIFDRNIYQGGGGQMGHTYRNIISADGGSGGPQMRLGALCENSLIIEGYWYSSTESNSPKNTWLTSGGQTGRSAIVRNNVQFIYKYPSPNDPDTDSASDPRAHPGWGYRLGGASFGALIENNIVSGAMLTDDLGFDEHQRGYGFSLGPTPREYQDGNLYTMQRCTVRNNIGYRTSEGLNLGGDWTDAMGHLVENNVFVANGTVGGRNSNLAGSEQVEVRDNRFYANTDALSDESWMGEGNALAPYAEAAASENWPDPDRTLKRYVTEKLNLTLLDWSDDPRLDPNEVARRVEAGEAYDPMGLKTFMAVATNMRKGGTDSIPKSGKPSWTGDYPWDGRFTGQAVVNWVREGFGMEPVGSSAK